ncbi:hypothetical protein N1030_07125 [Desulfovibrio mangrovi]|uniref:hypothetical protein n=1 Tax=Desulfovibrio mangrovi TaxID=2976983 RepID=UPI00224857DE|nr:hypothetical protein [Desulfovibrio mangrovi]UZP68735.1 hypothetical protein N1030_07125 [Desulfovibrio mangrovi]
MAQNATPNLPRPVPPPVIQPAIQSVAEDLRDIAGTLNRLRDDALPAHSVALDHLIDRVVQNANTIERRVDS